MENKPGDIPYCGVRKEFIAQAKPSINEENLKHLHNWISERYKIHLLKDLRNLPPPWTEDPILRKYRFTNVRREHDKETKWLIKNISQNPTLSYENKIMNIILFRLFNKSSTLEKLGQIDFSKKLSITDLRKKLKTPKKNTQSAWFSNAFYTSGPKRVANILFPKENNLPLKIIMLVKSYEEQKIVDKIRFSQTQSEVFNALSSLDGIGKFLAYQIFVDLTYLKDFQFSENEFVIAGPGCINGLEMIFTDFAGLNYEEALFWLRDNQNFLLGKHGYKPQELFEDLFFYDRNLNIMSLENSMCELSKYIRALKGQGRPKVLYPAKKAD